MAPAPLVTHWERSSRSAVFGERVRAGINGQISSLERNCLVWWGMFCSFRRHLELRVCCGRVHGPLLKVVLFRPTNILPLQKINLPNRKLRLSYVAPLGLGCSRICLPDSPDPLSPSPREKNKLQHSWLSMKTWICLRRPEKIDNNPFERPF